MKKAFPVCIVALCLIAYFALPACDDDEPTPEDCSNIIDDDGNGFADCDDPACAEATVCADEICDNEVDDDADGRIDCDDRECNGDPACGGDGDADGDADGDGDGDSDGDADGDGDGDADGDGDGDSDGDPCDPFTEECDFPCDSNDDCQLVLNMMNCCGGHPHTPDGEMDLAVCATAAPTELVDLFICVIPWSSGDPIPSVPEACSPYCTGVRCDPCPVEPVEAVCDQSTGDCVALGPDGCLTDDDCDSGDSCLDLNGDGFPECTEAEAECVIDDDCTALYPECAGCNCFPTGPGGLNECSCWDCGGSICFTDFDCSEAHYFCEEGSCEFLGDDTCYVGAVVSECGPCEWCEPDVPEDAENRRGHCRPMGDGGVEEDGGCVFPDAGE